MDSVIKSLRSLENQKVGSLSTVLTICLSMTTIRRDLLVTTIDAQRFLTENFELLKDHCLETYVSALVWLPAQPQIRKQYTDMKNFQNEDSAGYAKDVGCCETLLQGQFRFGQLCCLLP